MQPAHPDDDQLLFAILALQFEFVSAKAWSDAIDFHSANPDVGIESYLSAADEIQPEQRRLINELIRTWERESLDKDRLIQRFLGNLPRQVEPSVETKSFSKTLDRLKRRLRVEPSKSQSSKSQSSESPTTELESATRSAAPFDATDNHEFDTDHSDGSTRATGESLHVVSMIHGELMESRGGSDGDAMVHEDLRDHEQRYEVLEPLAEGGLGKVSIAQDHQLGRSVALKQIKERYVDDWDSQRRFVFEAAITGQLEHPGIVPVYSLGRDQQEKPFYAMRLIEGESFQKVINRFHRSSKTTRTTPNPREGHDGAQPAQASTQKPIHSRPDSLEFRQLLNRFLDICNAIDFAHNRGVLHRDLKPANVMIGAFGETFVVDWGLARHFGKTESQSGDQVEASDSLAEGTLQGTVIGTPAYMSPEQANGEVDSLGPASDIFSLGTILYTILTGKKAFAQPSTEQTIQAVRESKFDLPRVANPEVPPALQAICQKSMRRDPLARYATAGELAADIERWLADEPVSAWQEPLRVRAGRWVRRNRTWVTSGVALLLASTIGLLIVLGVQRESNRQLSLSNQREINARDFAQQQFDLALSAIGQYHNGVTSDFLLGQAEFHELRQELLVGPQRFYRELSESLKSFQHPSDKQRRALLDSHVNLALLAEKMNKQKTAISELQNALRVCDELESRSPSLDLKEQRGRIFISLSDSYRTTGEYANSTEASLSATRVLTDVKLADPNYPEIDSLLARTHWHFATGLAAASQPQAAAKEFTKALEINRRLAEGGSDGAKRSLAMCLSNLSNLQANLGENDQAIETAEESLSLYLGLQVKETRDSALIHEYSGNLTNLAYLYQEQQRNDDALRLYSQAEPAYRLLVSKAPNIVEFKSGLASTLNNMGLLFAAKKDRNKAQEKYRQALAIKEQLAADFADSVNLVVSLAGGYINYGGYLHGFKEYEQAIPWYDKGLDLLENVLAKHPQNAQAIFFQRNGLMNRARANRRLERYLDAASDFDKAIQVTADPVVLSQLNNERAQMLAFAGQHEAASQLAEQLRETAESDGDFFNLAFIHALAVESAEEDDELEGLDKQKQLSIYVRRAVEDLRSMFDSEALDEDQFLNLLDTNEYLRPLHKYPEFQDLRSEFE